MRSEVFVLFVVLFFVVTLISLTKTFAQAMPQTASADS